AIGGLIVGLNLAGRIRGIVEKAEALSPRVDEELGVRRKPTTVRDELGVLDAAAGRLTLSMDRFIRDSDILARLPEGMLLLGPSATLVSFNTTAEALLGLSLETYRGEPILSETGALPLSAGNDPLARLLEDEAAGLDPVHETEVPIVTAKGHALLPEITAPRRGWGGWYGCCCPIPGCSSSEWTPTRCRQCGATRSTCPRSSPTSSRSRWRPRPREERSVSASSRVGATTSASSSGTRAPASRPSFTSASSSRFSRRRHGGLDWGCPSRGRSWRRTAAPSSWRATASRRPASSWSSPPARP